MTLQRHTIRVLLATLALALTAGLCPLPASAAEKGIETDLTWGISNADRDRTVAGVQDLGASWMRLTMAWADIEKQDNSYTLSHYDNAINRAAAAGTKIVITVYTAPSWASGVSDRESPPQDPADYADFMHFAAQRWGDKVDAWEVWNEQNLWGFWSTGPHAGEYAQLLKAAYPAIKSADPTSLVVYGGVSYNDYRFIEGSYQEIPNLGDYYDVMASHPYSPDNPPEDVWYDPDGRLAKKSFVAYREIRDVMVANGDAEKPMWFTEFGWSTNTLDYWGVTEAEQADWLTRAYRCVEQDPYVQVAVWYIYRNHHWANNANTWVDQLGLTRTDFSPKPAYNAFKAYTPGSQGCAYNYPASPPDPAPEPEPTPEPEPSTESVDEPEAEPEEEDGIQTSSVRRRVGIRLVRFVDARTASRTSDAQPPRRMRVEGRVFKADRGRIALRLTCHGRDGKDWQTVAQRHARIDDTGRFDRHIRPRRNAACLLRAEYQVRGDANGRSRLVRFRT